MISKNEVNNRIKVEAAIVEFIILGKGKLENEFGETKNAIDLIAQDTTKDFITKYKKCISTEEIEYLDNLIKIGLYKSFCYGYAIGKIEKDTNVQLFI